MRVVGGPCPFDEHYYAICIISFFYFLFPSLTESSVSHTTESPTHYFLVSCFFFKLIIVKFHGLSKHRKFQQSITTMMGFHPPEPDCSEFMEVDPSGRYGRYNEILGKGASKIVYRAFDEYEGIEVAWNQVKLYDFLQSPEDLERLYCEIHLLKTLKHKNIMKFYTSWVDVANRNINFVTEMFTSGTLRQYRQKHKRVNIRAVKHWCRQILRGLLYLHSHDPPVIHRDLKCDNIFVNGNQGEVKIGDLGLAAFLRKSHAAHCVGTPEFMAPEVYEEEYNELVDIYSFGMCLLEMVTFEYPYSECTHPAQIYKKVISGKRPDALYKVKDPEVRQFVEKCLVTVSRRLSARELLKDPFLQIDDHSYNSRIIECQTDILEKWPLLRQPFFEPHDDSGSLISGYSHNQYHEIENGWDCNPMGMETHGIDIFTGQEDEPFTNVDITIKGKRRDDGGIFLRLRMADKEGHVRNIYFPFDIETDTASSVATEMVAELDITDQDVTKIAEMIDGEISILVPERKPGLGVDENSGFLPLGVCHHCASNGSSDSSLLDHYSNNPHGDNTQVLHCSRIGCAALHGRFEEVMYQVEESEHCVTDGAPVVFSQSDGLQYTDIWAQHEGPNLSLEGSEHTHSDDESEQLNRSTLIKDDTIFHTSNHMEPSTRKSMHELHYSSIDHQSTTKITGHNPPTTPSSVSDDYENDKRQELRWLKAKYLMELRDISDRQIELISRKQQIENRVTDSSVSTALQGESFEPLLKSFAFGKQLSCHFPSPDSRNLDTSSICPYSDTQRDRYCEAKQVYSPEHIFTAKSFFTGPIFPSSLHRSRSLPVDAVDV